MDVSEESTAFAEVRLQLLGDWIVLGLTNEIMPNFLFLQFISVKVLPNYFKGVLISFPVGCKKNTPESHSDGECGIEW